MAAEQAAPSVVVVDDEPAITELICSALEDTGIRALGCTHAAEAFWFIQRARPSVAILDLQMPGVDGLALLEQLRADAHTADLPIIFLTGHAVRLRQRLPDTAALNAHVLAKPFKLDQVLDLVHQIVAGRTSQG